MDDRRPRDVQASNQRRRSVRRRRRGLPKILRRDNVRRRRRRMGRGAERRRDHHRRARCAQRECERRRVRRVPIRGERAGTAVRGDVERRIRKRRRLRGRRPGEASDGHRAPRPSFGRRCRLARAVRGPAGRARWDVRRDVRFNRRRNALASNLSRPGFDRVPGGGRAHRPGRFAGDGDARGVQRRQVADLPAGESRGWRDARG